MKKTIITVLATLTFMGTTTVAGQAKAECTATSCTGPILRLIAKGGTTDHLVRLEGDGVPTDNTCALQDNYYWVVKKDDADIYKLLLSALLAGKEVRLRKVEGKATCTVSYAWLDR